MHQNVSRPFRRILDLVLPPTCTGCGCQVVSAQTLCPECWSQLSFLSTACCDACGYPFSYEVPNRTLCGACVANPPPFDHARAALVYDDHSRTLVLGFKHADRTEAAELYAKWMVNAGRDLVMAVDVIVPVPLHWTRLFQRRYNQAALLAHQMGKLVGKPVLADGLARIRKTPSQGRLGRMARARNVQGAFSVSPRHMAKLKGKRVLLVDDVYTTGATLRTAARVLKRAGCGGVEALVLARVVREFV